MLAPRKEGIVERAILLAGSVHNVGIIPLYQPLPKSNRNPYPRTVTMYL